MLITAADVVDEVNDLARLTPMVEQAEEVTGVRVPTTLADGGYFAGRRLEECAQRGQQVVMPDPKQQSIKQDPYPKDRFTYDEDNDCYYWPRGQTLHFVRNKRNRGEPVRLPGLSVSLPGVSSLRSLHKGPPQGTWLGTGALRCSIATASCLDGDWGGQEDVQAAKAVGRAGFRNHQRATGGSEVPVARPCQRVCRMDGAGYRLQPAHALEGVALPSLHFPPNDLRDGTLPRPLT